MPDIVFIHVPEYKGPSYFSDKEKIVPITPIRRRWFSRKIQCQRIMIPLQPAYAMTIHKSQGMSLDKIIANLGPAEFSMGLSYTALSRCRSIHNLALQPFPEFTRFRNMFRKPGFLQRRKEDNNAAEKEKETIKKGYLG